MDLCTWRTFKTQRAIFKYPSLSLATQVLTVVGIGLLAAALEEFEKISTGKASITNWVKKLQTAQ